MVTVARQRGRRVTVREEVVRLQEGSRRDGGPLVTPPPSLPCLLTPPFEHLPQEGIYSLRGRLVQWIRQWYASITRSGIAQLIDCKNFGRDREFLEQYSRCLKRTIFSSWLKVLRESDDKIWSKRRISCLSVGET
jgi:hypothetical protein